MTLKTFLKKGTPKIMSLIKFGQPAESTLRRKFNKEVIHTHREPGQQLG
jgi:hypothetical protein